MHNSEPTDEGGPLAGVDAKGVCHLIEALDYANALGGGVAVLEASDALAAYFRGI